VVTSPSIFSCMFCIMNESCVGLLFNGYILVRLGRIRSYFLSSVESLSGDLLSTQLYELAMSLKNYPIVTMTVSLGP
jgi:hypothetical protein